MKFLTISLMLLASVSGAYACARSDFPSPSQLRSEVASAQAHGAAAMLAHADAEHDSCNDSDGCAACQSGCCHTLLAPVERVAPKNFLLANFKLNSSTHSFFSAARSNLKRPPRA